MKMKYIIKQVSILLLLVYVFTACQQEIDDYFYKETQDEYVDTDVLTLIKQEPRFSAFVDLIEELHADTIINNGNSFTLFIPDNEALMNLDSSVSKQDLFNYLVTESFINIHQIGQSTLLQSYGGKFVKFEVLGDSAFRFDGVEVMNGSPLTNNGRYYELADVVNPRPNIYEYFTQSNPFFASYFDSKDSVFLDKELSTPLFFNEFGQTVYDTVLTTINTFEAKYFEISEEFRNVKATMLVFSQEQYDAALDAIYSQLGIDSIPSVWQNDVLMPYVLNRSMFRNALNYDGFLFGRALNILGDSVDVEPEKINPNYYECSNGRVYNYEEFYVPEELYKVSDTVYLVDRLNKLGEDQNGDPIYEWGDEFDITGTKFTPQSSNNQLIVDMGDRNYSEDFSFSYKHYNIFPGTYRLKLRVNLVGNIGVWKVFVNDTQLPFKDFYNYLYGSNYWDWEYDLNDLREGFVSPYPSESSPVYSTYVYNGQSCTFEALVENIDQFGDVNVRLEYVRPSSNTSRNAGITIEFVSLEYYEE